MKLRIKGNSIRFRLTQTEIDKVGLDFVEDKTQFPEGNSLIYKIQKGNSFSVKFLDGVLLISAPSEIIKQWATTDKVSIDRLIDLEDGSQLEIYLEKDFKCLTKRPKEDETDMFPNPLENHD